MNSTTEVRRTQRVDYEVQVPCPGVLDYIGVMENKMETAVVSWGCIGRIQGLWVYIGVILGEWKMEWKLRCIGNSYIYICTYICF